MPSVENVDELEDSLAPDHAKLVLLNEELNKQRELFATRAASVQARAAILVAAAGLGSGLQATRLDSGWYVLAILFAALSAGLGIGAMRPRYGGEIKMPVLRNAVFSAPENVALLQLIDAKIEVHESDELRLTHMGEFLRWGFIALTTSIVFTLMAVLNL